MFFESILGPLKTAFSYITDYWWTVTPFLFGFGAYWAWINFKRQEYISSIEWALLEIKPPSDVEKSPKIAENIFSGFHAAYFSPKTWKDRFFRGEVQDWFSFEIIGSGDGNMRFYVRTPIAYKNVVENLIFSQYPDAEIEDAEDYVQNLPPALPDAEYDLFGTELVFAKPDVFPIKTYPDFEEESGGRESETKRTEPLSFLAEQVSTLEPGEHIWIQVTIRSTGEKWFQGAKAEVDKILGKQPKPESDIATKALTGLVDMLPGGGSPENAKKEEKSEKDIMKLTPGEKFLVDSIERKAAKLGFKSGIRFIYIGRKEAFHRSHTTAVIGMFKQFYSNNLNTFKPNKVTMTYTKGWFKFLFPSDKGFAIESILYKRKRNLYNDYRKRNFTKQHIILNTEELATLWHLPGAGIKAPLFPRVESKKGQPPAGLPTK